MVIYIVRWDSDTPPSRVLLIDYLAFHTCFRIKIIVKILESICRTLYFAFSEVSFFELISSIKLAFFIFLFPTRDFHPQIEIRDGKVNLQDFLTVHQKRMKKII